MKTKFGMSIGLALTLMVGVFATMLALGLFTPTEARATSVTGDSLDFTPDNVDTVTQVTVVFTTSGEVTGVPPAPDTTGAMGTDGEIFITFPATAGVPSAIDNSDVTVGHSGITTTGNVEDAESVKVSGQTVTVAITSEIAADTGVTVIFKEDAGIVTPLVAETQTVMVTTSSDKDAAEVTDLTTAPLTAHSDAVYDVVVKHRPDGAGDAARVQVDFRMTGTLTADVDTITIAFNDDVQMPDVLSESSISIVGVATGTTRIAANPADVFVELVGTPADDPRVTLTVPDMDGDGTNNNLVGTNGNLVSVVFRQSAGIKNPTAASTWPVTVTASGHSAGTSKSFRSRSLVTDATLSLNNTKGKRGSTATASGKGFKDGTTATVWLDQMSDGVQQGGEPTLCTADIAKSDTFDCTFTIGAAFKSGKNANVIQVKDGNFTTAVEARTWTVSSQVIVVPSSDAGAAIGDTVTVQLRDYLSGDTFTFDEDVSATHIIELGGQVVEYERFTISDGSADITATIPNGVSLGVQTLQVTIGSDKPTTKLNVLGAQVTASPSTVVPNQSVTITGRGFSRNAKIINPSASNAPTPNHSQILVGGTLITEWDKINGGDPIDIDSGGSWVATIVIPVKSPATAAGTYEFKVIDSMGRPGVTFITVPKRTVTFEPPESRVGSDVTVSGTGWVASNGASEASSDIEVDYVSVTGRSSARANPDSNGAFSTTIQVPRNAPIPSTNQVTVSYEVETTGGSDVSEQVSHRVPGAEVTITPSSGPGGTVATVTGAGFKAFTSLETIHIGETRVTPNPAGASVGRDGVLQSVTILIPALDPGTLSVKVNVSDSIANTAFTITADDAPLATTAEDTTPDVAFKEPHRQRQPAHRVLVQRGHPVLLVLRPGSGQRRVQRPGDGRQRRHLLGPVERGR